MSNFSYSMRMFSSGTFSNNRTRRMFTASTIYDALSITIFTLSILLNGMVTVALLKNIKKTLLDKLLLSLASNDLCRAIISYLPHVLELVAERELISGPPCNVIAFVITSLALTSISHIVALSLECAVTISVPYFTSMLVDCHNIRNAILAVTWFYGILWATPPLFGWSRYAPLNHKECSIDWQNSTAEGKSYVIMLLIFCFALPLTIMIASFCVVHKELTMSKERARSLLGRRHHATRSSHSAKVKHSKMVLTIVTCFVSAWTPYAVVSLLMAGGATIPIELTLASRLLGKSSSVFNPIIYVLTKRKYRYAVRKLFQTFPAIQLSKRVVLSVIKTTDGSEDSY